jgi:hypothetical protein
MAGHYVEITIKVIERDKKRSTEFPLKVMN